LVLRNEEGGDTQMQFKKLMVAGAAALAVLGSVAGIALASTGGAKAPAKQADAVTTSANTNPSKAAVSVKASSSEDSEAPESSESEAPGEKEGPESDGPGGHEDPPGQDVQHEFEGEE
jgi:hypothetical protein